MAGVDDIRAAQRPADYPLTYSRGDSLDVQFQLRDGRNRPVDLTGVTVAAIATDAWDYAVSWTLVASVADAATGLVDVGWPASTGALLPSSGVWELVLTGADWEKTVVTGSLTESRSGVASCGPCGGACPSTC